ncbi:pre-mRNA-splicing factor prp46, partial [Coemansia sp. S155-1]
MSSIDSQAAYSLEPLVQAVVHGTNGLFQGTSTPALTADARIKSRSTNIATKYRDEYMFTRELPRGAEIPGTQPSNLSTSTQLTLATARPAVDITNVDEEVQKVLDGLSGKQSKTRATKKVKQPTRDLVLAAADKASRQLNDDQATAAAAGQHLVRKRNYEPVKPEWHAPWRMMRVISGHIGWVRSLAV